VEAREAGGESLEFGAVAEVETHAAGVDHHRPALVVESVPGPQHADVGREAGAGRDEDEVVVGLHVVQGEHADDLAAEPDAVSGLQGEEPRRQRPVRTRATKNSK
jgi:hypothetical protein